MKKLSSPWWLAITVFGVVLAVDINLLAPWVSWGHDSFDSGDLISSAYYLGIPHPTGYPTYCILAKLVQTLVPIGNIAWRTNLFSALCGAFCSAVVAWALFRALSAINRENGGNPTMIWVIAGIAGLGLGFSRTFLSQSVVSEVYTLNAAFVALVVAFIVEIICSIHEGRADAHVRKNLFLLSLFFGLTLTNHLSSAFVLPIVIAAFILARRTIRPRDLAAIAGFFILGLIPYLYLPIRSASNTPYDWGNPQTLNGFLWVVTGKQFKHLMFASFDYQVVHRVFDKFEPILEVGPMLSLALFWGAATVVRGGLSSRISLLGLSLMVVNLIPVMNYHIPDTQPFLLPTFIAVTLLAGLGLSGIITAIAKVGGKNLPWAVLITLLVLSLPWYISNIKDADLSNHERPREYADRVYAELPDGAILIETYYGRAFTMWYKHFIDARGERKQIAVIYAEHLLFDWGIEKLRRLYPWVDFPDADPNEGRVIKVLVEKNSTGHPIFVSREILSLKDTYRFVPFGEIFLLEHKENKENKDDYIYTMKTGER